MWPPQGSCLPRALSIRMNSLALFRVQPTSTSLGIAQTASCKQEVTAGGNAQREDSPLDNVSPLCDTTATDALARFTCNGQGLQTPRQGVDWSVTSDRPSGPFSPQSAYLNN